jgi:hypothetical protein
MFSKLLKIGFLCCQKELISLLLVNKPFRFGLILFFIENRTFTNRYLDAILTYKVFSWIKLAQCLTLKSGSQY